GGGGRPGPAGGGWRGAGAGCACTGGDPPPPPPPEAAAGDEPPPHAVASRPIRASTAAARPAWLSRARRLPRCPLPQASLWYMSYSFSGAADRACAPAVGRGWFRKGFRAGAAFSPRAAAVAAGHLAIWPVTAAAVAATPRRQCRRGPRPGSGSAGTLISAAASADVVALTTHRRN